MAFDTARLEHAAAVSNKVLIRLGVLAQPNSRHESCTALHWVRLAEKHSFTKATKKASVLLAPASLESRRAFRVTKVTVHKPLRMTHQPSEKCRVHRKVNVVALENLKA